MLLLVVQKQRIQLQTGRIQLQSSRIQLQKPVTITTWKLEGGGAGNDKYMTCERIMNIAQVLKIFHVS